MKTSFRMSWDPTAAGLRMAASLLLAISAVTGCREAPAVAPPPPPEVTVATPEVRDVTVFEEFVGTTEAFRSVEIRARVQGFLDRMAFEPSSFVQRGQLLFVIEPAPYEAQRDRAAANLKSAQAALRRAESDLDRLEQAVRTNAVSQQEVTRARAERDQASAALLEAQAALTNAEIQLGYTRLVSPIDGLVSRNYVDVGNLVGVGEPTLLTTVRRIDPIYAYFEVSERFVARALQQQGGHRDPDELEDTKATLLLEETGLEIEGYLDTLENTVDTATGTIRVRGVFPNPNAKIFPGFFVRVRLPGEEIEDAVLVRETALGTDLGGRYVMVVGADDVVERRYIEPGPLQSDGTRVILQGLEAGERYISEGLQRARPGLPVTPVEAAGQ
jgi:RND family efflux transporter MFP subunit